VATEYNLGKIIGDIKVCIYFKIFKVKVPINFSGTQGFPARRDKRYVLYMSLLTGVHTQLSITILRLSPADSSYEQTVIDRMDYHQSCIE
jgi:hypothetical protein